MLEFFINYWIVFAVIAIVLLLGLFGYIQDRKKYDEYRKEILNEGTGPVTSVPANIEEVKDTVSVEDKKEEPTQ